MTLLSPSAKGMQKLLDICQSFAIEFDILYNTTKSVCLYFESKKFKLLTIPYVMLDGKRIEYVDSHKLLGMVIENSGSDKKDIARQIRSLYFRANMLVRKFSSCSYQVKRQLFMSYCTNLYCVQLWSVYTAGQLQKLRVAYNNSFRRLFKLPFRCSASEMFVYNAVPTLDMLIRKSVHSIETRLKRSKNEVLQALWSCDHGSSNKLQTRWDSVLRTRVHD